MFALLSLLLSLAVAAPSGPVDDRALFLAWSERARPLDDPTGLSEGYHGAEALWDELADTVRAHPALQVENLGVSVEGQPIWAFHLRPDHVDRSLLVLAGLHPMEWIGTEVALAHLHDALDDPQPGHLLTVVPLANPDGRRAVEGDLRRGKDRLVRRTNARGVDLNRDGAVHRDPHHPWARLLPRRHAVSPAPLSQPESQALDRLAARERYDRAASLHSFGGFLYYPWSGRWQRPADHAAFVALAEAMQRAQGRHAYRVRQLSRWGFFFRAHGSEIDHLYGSYGTLAFLVELTRTGITPTHGLKTPFRWYNPAQPTPHLDRGRAALWALWTEDDLGTDTPR